MAVTHQQVVKVWIAPGCIVCDACETDCPEVFDVQEETCVIRPEAQKGDFTKPLTPSIIIAAEGCPVDVIKFETIEVEGPEPWAGKEDEPAVAVGGGVAAPAKKKAAAALPEGPPDPRWAKLLSTSHTSGSRSAGGSTVTMRRSARVPADAIKAALPADAPPDALAAAMIGSGFSRPQLSVGERIRRRASSAVTSAAGMTRRRFNWTLAVAWGAMAATGAIAGGALQSFMVPKVIIEPQTVFRVGRRSDYAEPGVYEDFKPQGFWLIHLPEGSLVALSTICTHLGCIPNWMPAEFKFKCPCHGSGFYMNGVNFEGPASRPLERLKISMDGEWIMVDKAIIFRSELSQWDSADSFLAM
jgi:cytochrome b6-f complex iron-sulfur subunit